MGCPCPWSSKHLFWRLCEIRWALEALKSYAKQEFAEEGAIPDPWWPCLRAWLIHLHYICKPLPCILKGYRRECCHGLKLLSGCCSIRQGIGMRNLWLALWIWTRISWLPFCNWQHIALGLSYHWQTAQSLPQCQDSGSLKRNCRYTQSFAALCPQNYIQHHTPTENPALKTEPPPEGMNGAGQTETFLSSRVAWWSR